MVDINVVVANNIMDQMKKHNTKQIDLANAIGVSKQIMSKMLNGSRLISVAELHKIEDYFHIKTDDLLQIYAEPVEVDVMLHGRLLLLLHREQQAAPAEMRR